jgi:hypothetical protein
MGELAEQAALVAHNEALALEKKRVYKEVRREMDYRRARMTLQVWGEWGKDKGLTNEGLRKAFLEMEDHDEGWTRKLDEAYFDWKSAEIKVDLYIRQYEALKPND